jgi:hypothetical protein
MSIFHEELSENALEMISLERQKSERLANKLTKFLDVLKKIAEMPHNKWCGCGNGRGGTHACQTCIAKEALK